MPADMYSLNPDAPAYYCICIQGPLDDRWLEMLSGAWVIRDTDDSNRHVTILVGSVADQAALLGTLNHLCDLGMPLISVEWLVHAPELHIVPPGTTPPPAACESEYVNEQWGKGFTSSPI